MFPISQGARFALDRLEKNGFEAYLVGGCVRDGMIGRTTNDYDVTTNAFPSEIKTVFFDCKTIDVGIAHGTVAVVCCGEVIEITTYRIDGEYKDNRHPENVSFSSDIKDDLSRRDFTVNAMAYNGELVDYFGGLEDISKRIIRCVGDPDTRFKEDALRILRAMRFSSVLGFEIEEKTAEAVRSNAHLLLSISRERILIELKKLLCGAFSREVIEKFGCVLDNLFKGKGFESRSFALGRCENAFEIRLACLFLKNSFYEYDLTYLKLDRKTYKRVCAAISSYGDVVALKDKTSVKKAVSRLGMGAVADIALLAEAEGDNFSIISEALGEIKNNNECVSFKSLAVNGNDLAVLGISGKNVGDHLALILDLVIEGKIKNTREDIISYIKEKQK